MSNPIEQMVDAVVRCVLCGKKSCDCWESCPCGWAVRKGMACNNCGLGPQDPPVWAKAAGEVR